MNSFFSLRTVLRRVPLWAALALSLLHLNARADLWAYVDDQGITHFAATQVDERYKLFFKGADLLKLDLVQDAAATGGLTPLSKAGTPLKAAARPAEPAFAVPKRYADLDSSRGYQAVQKHMKAAAKQHAIDYELIKAVIAAESGFNPVAVSPKGAVGLMQLMPTTAERYGVLADKSERKDRKGQPLPLLSIEQKLVDPQTNINAGARYLAYLIKLFKGDMPLAVAAYNAGEGAVQRAGNKVPNYKETQGYVKTVMGLYGVFKPASNGTVVASAAAPTAAGKMPRGRVRVELAGAAPAKRDAANAAAAAQPAATDGGALRQVVYVPPAPAAALERAGAVASGAASVASSSSPGGE